MIDDTRVEPQGIRVGPRAIGCGHPAHERHADLGAKARAEPQGILHGIRAALRQVEASEVRVYLLEVSNRRHQAGLQGFDGEDIFDACPHGVARIALGVADDDLIRRSVEDMAQRVDLGLRTPSPRRGVGLVRDENGLGSDVIPVDAPLLLGPRDQVFHHMLDVRHVEACTMEGAVGGHRTQDLGDRPHTALAHRLGTLYHDRRSPHTYDHAMAATIKRKRGLLDHLVSGSGSCGQEARPDPVQQVVRRDVVRGDNDDAAAPSGTNPVFGQAHGLRRRCTGGVDLCIRPTRPDVFGKLRMRHRQDPKQQLTFQVIGLLVKPCLQLMDTPVDFAGEGVVPVEGDETPA